MFPTKKEMTIGATGSIEAFRALEEMCKRAGLEQEQTYRYSGLYGNSKGFILAMPFGTKAIKSKEPVRLDLTQVLRTGMTSTAFTMLS